MSNYDSHTRCRTANEGRRSETPWWRPAAASSRPGRQSVSRLEGHWPALSRPCPPGSPRWPSRRRSVLNPPPRSNRDRRTPRTPQWLCFLVLWWWSRSSELVLWRTWAEERSSFFKNQAKPDGQRIPIGVSGLFKRAVALDSRLEY